MLIVTKKCVNKECGLEVTVVIAKESVKEGIYAWTCPSCGHTSGLLVAIAKRKA